jgi:hypothetical protein
MNRYVHIVNRLVQDIQEWLQELPTKPIGKREWFLVEEGSDYIQVYIRIGYHSLDGRTLCTCLDIASIEIEPKREGIFTLLISKLEGLSIPFYLYVEEAVAFLGASLVKRGWIRKEGEDNYYRRPHENSN